jgi:hypothetical protein
VPARLFTERIVPRSPLSDFLAASAKIGLYFQLLLAQDVVPAVHRLCLETPAVKALSDFSPAVKALSDFSLYVFYQ